MWFQNSGSFFKLDHKAKRTLLQQLWVKNQLSLKFFSYDYQDGGVWWLRLQRAGIFASTVLLVFIYYLGKYIYPYIAMDKLKLV